MKKLKKLFAIVVLVFLSCSDKNEINSDSMSSSKDYFIMCTYDLIDASNKMTSKPDAAIIDWPRWQTGQTIKIKFLDGDISQQEIVKKYTSEWVTYANLKFEFVPKNESADIRIAFNLGTPGAWSQLGMKSAYGVGNYQNEPSMRLGPINENAGSKRTILHEFGHALGLVHETTNPDANIKWNLSKVYAYYDDLMGWSKEDVDSFVINPRSVTNYSKYDATSIMHYYIPASLTTDGVAVYEQNVLSPIDKNSILSWYPFPVRSIIETEERIDLATLRKSVKSPDGRYSLEFDSGCLFILDSTNNQKTWSVGSPVYTNAFCYFQSSGEIIITGSLPPTCLSCIVWRSKISKVSGAQLHLQNDGSLELIQNGVVKWSSKTGKI